jgi:hypothetical protein
MKKVVGDSGYGCVFNLTGRWVLERREKATDGRGPYAKADSGTTTKGSGRSSAVGQAGELNATNRCVVGGKGKARRVVRSGSSIGRCRRRSAMGHRMAPLMCDVYRVDLRRP